MDESEDVAVYTAPWRQLGKDGRLHFFFPLLHNDLTCLPLPHNLLIPCCDLLVNLRNTQGHIDHLVHTSHQNKLLWQRSVLIKIYLSHVFLVHPKLVVAKQKWPHLLSDLMLHPSIVNQPQQLQLLIILARDKKGQMETAGLLQPTVHVTDS